MNSKDEDDMQNEGREIKVLNQKLFEIMLQVTKTNSPNRIRQQINFNSLAKNVNKLFTDLEISSNNIGLTAQPVLIYVDQPKKFM